MESHNHPSQVEPRQGAATGIGGIVRDIFTVGARPIACLDSLRFGELDDPEHGAKARYLFAGVVDGISFYGNCIGVPTVAGEVAFNASYRGNCLVGAMCVGVVESDKIASGAAAGAGNAVMYFGNATGRDGIGGCSILASHEMSDLAQRPTVQVGDPFAEKCLIEACLEALQTGAIVSMKDMGAAGLTCTTCEQAAAGGMGMDIDLAMVPLREEGMEPFEIMMSESQERMLAVVQAGREAEVAAIFEKWGAHARVLGRVTDDGILRVRVREQVVAEMTAQSLADAPLYHLPFEEPSYLAEKHAFNFALSPSRTTTAKSCCVCCSRPTSPAKNGFIRSMTTACRSTRSCVPVMATPPCCAFANRRATKASPLRPIATRASCYLDPFMGAQIAIAECARNLVCVGAEPAARPTACALATRKARPLLAVQALD
jgi:phosphoribosylformylglycinamidine synthase